MTPPRCRNSDGSNAADPGRGHLVNGRTPAMHDSDVPLEMIDETAVAAAELRHEPYDFAFVEHALPERLKEEVLADAPQIPDRGSYGLPDLQHGQHFGGDPRP